MRPDTRMPFNCCTLVFRFSFSVTCHELFVFQHLFFSLGGEGDSFLVLFASQWQHILTFVVEKSSNFGHESPNSVQFLGTWNMLNAHCLVSRVVIKSRALPRCRPIWNQDSGRLKDRPGNVQRDYTLVAVFSVKTHIIEYLDPPRGAKWMGVGVPF